MMKKYLLLSFLTLWAAQSFAADSIALNPDIDFAMNGKTNITFPLNVVSTTKTPTEAAPAKVYVPMGGPNGQANYIIEKGVTTLFSKADAGTNIQFPLYVNVGAGDRWLYVAVKATSTASNPYRLTKKIFTTPYNSVTNRNETVPLTTPELCSQQADCDNFAATSNTEKKLMVYFFLSADQALTIPQDIDPVTAYPGGIFFEVNMSNRIYDSTQVLPVITAIRSGDKRVIISYTSTTNIASPKAMRVFIHDGAPGIVNQPIQNYYTAQAGSRLYTTEFAYAYSGEVTVNNLENDSQYFLSVLLEDQYKFGTVLSDDALGEAKAIEELLKKNACFLLTAGFGEDHYVISYFRHFRDTVLSQSYLGRAFINIYYETAPKYALMIYQHEGIRAVIRGFAYTLYFIFNFYYVFIAGAVFAGAALVYRKRDKFRPSL
ncbi:CFI-box-CTERM domain-containing protein [Bacteriovorax sp. PP10]|uniref:CFI-box-CTERM domain-containing protein n=1 Tax=Bacteriovorax antarcticus TaxID=3088717 RepID=A0ABU5VSW7_9BACT|nr:CFI-box-CTERM domain-containing protein [Bacteriovorax sp. PP10]MEA9356149.1 CFI-box-CTERM domain-containing protein [Bacteriovorax sp. PP10]